MERDDVAGSPRQARRLFFALWPDAALQAAISTTACAIARERAIGGREIPPERVHLTLLFLGDVPAAAEPRLVAGAGAMKGRAFALALEQAGCFYRSRVFWLGARQAPAELTLLHLGLKGVAAAAGIEIDRRPLAPHVTCLRDIRHRIRPVPVTPVGWPVRDFALVHSVLGATPEYRVLARWPLGSIT